jgi:hypothetical protein
MDAAKRESYKLPAEWVDRIFLRLNEIYGDKFMGQFSKPEYIDLAKTVWRGGLAGLNSSEIKHALSICLNELSTPPNCIEFFHYAKKYRVPPPPKVEPTKASQEVHKLYMDKIKGILNGKLKPNNRDIGSNRNHPVPANDEPVLDNEAIPQWLL